MADVLTASGRATSIPSLLVVVVVVVVDAVVAFLAIALGSNLPA